MGIREMDPLSQLSLPPGFRFYPTDEELLVQYLCKKVAGHHFNLQIIGEIDLYKFDPWFLPSKALFGEKEWYFFSPRDRKYPNGSRPNRVAGSGYWKATGTDKVITTQGRKVGIKKALVFYVGKAPKGIKTNWIMHEYRLFEPPKKDGSAKLDEWVLCRLYKKNSGGAKQNIGVHQSKEHSIGESSTSSASQYDDVLESLPEMDDRFLVHNVDPDKKINLQNMGSGSFDWATLAGLSTLPELGPGDHDQTLQPNVNVNYGLGVGVGVGSGNNISLNQHNDWSVPTFVPQFYNVNVDQEAQSGIKSERVDNSSSFFPMSSNSLSHGFTSSVDPFGIRYPTQSGSWSFKH